MKTKVIVHCLVANEERFVWYAINSVLPFANKIMVWDTGSSDNTVKIIKAINSPKIELKELGLVDAQSHTIFRDKMLQETNKEKYDWLLILDGDEIWTSGMLKKMIGEAEKYQPAAVVVRTVNFVGDIYHKEPDSAGHYRFADRVGHYNLRLINLKLPNLHVSGPHGQQGYYSNKTLLQNLPVGKLLILDDVYYLHATHLERSPFDKLTLKRAFKRKFELGEKMDRGHLPKIFFDHPRHVIDVTKPMDFFTFGKCLLYTIPRRIKRRLFPPKHGY